jgi:hypothetical protein
MLSSTLSPVPLEVGSVELVIVCADAVRDVFVCLFVIILHSPPKGGAQLSYHKPAEH